MGNHPFTVESVSAVIVSQTGRFLMQLRDADKPIAFPGHWGLFGGHVEAGENVHTAVRRELQEEIAFSPAVLTLATAFVYELIKASGTQWERESVFVASIGDSEVGSLRLMEGSAMALWDLDDLLRQPKIVPIHAAALRTLAPRL